MSIFKKILLVGASVLLIIILAGTLYLRHLARRGIPDYNSDVDLSGMQDSVKIYRDQYAVPHILARNESDLYRAFGYCMAQDRIWQMDLLRRVTQGRLAEIFGKDLVEYDLLMRSLRITAKSKRIYARSDSSVKIALQAFSDGINQYLETHQKSLPLEYSLLNYKPDKWQPIHSINLIGYMAWNLTFPWENEVMLYKIKQKTGSKYEQLLPDLENQTSLVHPRYTNKESEIEIIARLKDYQNSVSKLGVNIFRASNNWVVAQQKSETGYPILANDMHLDLNSPGIWYQAHHIVEGKLNVRGVVVPGSPFIVAGHNAHIAWGFTNVSVDDMDFYKEKINPDKPHQYLYNGQWHDMNVQKETIHIKDSESVEKKLYFTHRGPIISRFKDIKNQTISMRWVGNEKSNEISSIYYLNRASDWQEFKKAVKQLKTVSQNVAYADREGNIGLYSCTGIPIRKKGEGLLIRPGWTDKYDWKGLVPFEELPYTYNPESGFAASANNKTVGDSYPYHISNWFSPPYRIDRIRDLLRNKSKLSKEDFKKIQNDHHSKLVENMSPQLLQILNQNRDAFSAQERQAIDYFNNWDGHHDKNSISATMFDQFYLCYLENVLKDEMGEELFKEFLNTTYLPMYAVNNLWQNEKSLWYDNINTDGKNENFRDIIIHSFKETVHKLSNRMGESIDNWQWGQLHRLTLKHPLANVKILDRIFNLNKGSYPVGGSFHTVGYYGYKFNKPFGVSATASQRHIYDLANWDSSLTIIPTGNCGVPASQHYGDQCETYVQGKYHPAHFNLEQVVRAAKYKMIIY